MLLGKQYATNMVGVAMCFFPSTVNRNYNRHSIKHAISHCPSAQRWQLEMRKKFLGEAFWVKKMHLFNEARANIIKEADGSASKAVRPTYARDIPCEKP